MSSVNLDIKKKVQRKINSLSFGNLPPVLISSFLECFTRSVNTHFYSITQNEILSSGNKVSVIL